jgi:DNA-binding MarR family transcriptional regulator
MKETELSPNEKLMLYGLVTYPTYTDKQLSDLLNLKHSTVTTIRNRLRKSEYYRTIEIPKLQNLGCNLLVVIYTSFSPLIPLEERVEITGKTIEIFEEIFFSVGEHDKGFSLSFSKDYATIGRINDIRTQTFGGRGLLENEYPNMVVFPFEISKIYRFFDFSNLLRYNFQLDFRKNIETRSLVKTIDIHLSDTEKDVYYMFIKYPEFTDTKIGNELGISRHSVSRLRKGFENNDLVGRMNLPDFKKLGFEIFTFFHIQFDPQNPPNMDNDDAALLLSDSTIFFATRRYEACMLSLHSDFDDYNMDKTRILQVLKENKWIAENPIIHTYSLKELNYIKNFRFAPIARKIVGCDLLL